MTIGRGGPPQDPTSFVCSQLLGCESSVAVNGRSMERCAINLCAKVSAVKGVKLELILISRI